jgi:hypothetical protein
VARAGLEFEGATRMKPSAGCERAVDVMQARVNQRSI